MSRHSIPSLTSRCLRAWPTAGAMVIALSSCSSPAGPKTPLPEASPPVVVTMRDHRFEYNPNIPPGRVVFRVVNAGQAVHRLTIIPLGEDFPPIDEQLRGSNRRVVTPFAGIPNQDPGDGGSFAADLVPGRRYAMVCFVTEPDGESHALKGMTSEFRAGGTGAPPNTPSGPPGSPPVRPAD